MTIKKRIHLKEHDQLKNKTKAERKTNKSLRHVLLILLTVLTLSLFFDTIYSLMASSLSNELYSHAIIIPFVSGYLIYSKRNQLLSGTYNLSITGFFLIFVSLTMYWACSLTQISCKLGTEDYMSLTTFAAVGFWTGGLLIAYGTKKFRSLAFPALFLLLMIPMPEMVKDGVITFLQAGSADVTEAVFRLANIPFHRDGTEFYLKKVAIEVAPECSGIRSSLALLITSLIAGHFYLKTKLRKSLLVLAVIPIAVVKNGFRIAVLTLFGVYVDERALTGPLHNNGGVIFFLLGLSVLGVILWVFRRTEKKKGLC